MMNKRHLRKYLSPDWKPNLKSGLLYVKNIEYVLRSTVRNIDHTRMLILYVYSVKQLKNGSNIPCYTVFQSKNAYLTYEQIENEKPRWRVCNFRGMLAGYYRNLISLSAFYTRDDELRTMRFCNNEGNDGFEALSSLQDRIFYDDCERRKKAKAKIRRKLMNDIGDIPKSVEKWVKNDVLPSHGFYTYAKHKKAQLVYCTHCQTENLISGVRHAKQGVCPNCGRYLTFHALGKTSFVSDRFTVQFIEKVGERLLLRVLKGYMSYSGYYRIPTFRIWENARIFFFVKDGLMESEAYYYSYNDDYFPWRKGYRPVINHWCYHFEADLCGHLYTNNLDKVLRGTPWQYSQLKKYYLSTCEPMNLLKYMEAYFRYPMIEYLVKYKLYNLTTDFVYHSSGGHDSCINARGTNMRDALNISPIYLPLMQKCNISMSGLSTLQKLTYNGFNVNDEFISWCQDNKLHDADRLTIALRHMSTHKLMRYLTEQHKSLQDFIVPFDVRPYREMHSMLVCYTDYLDFCKKLKYDMTNSFVLFPAHVKEAHDTTSKLFDEQKAKMWNESIMELFPVLTKQYQFEKAGLTISAPKSSDEIVHEGQTLHHCVNGYVERMAKHETAILFLRKKDEPDKPYYTIEVQNNSVKQIRGDHNCDTTERIDSFIDAWKQAKLVPALQAA